jgi:putative hydrolase
VPPNYHARVSDADPFGDGRFQSFFTELAKLFGGPQGDPWQAAGHLAVQVATQGRPEPNVDPLVRSELEPLVRVADLHVGQATGLSAVAAERVEAVTRSEWSRRSVAAYRPLFERFAEALGRAQQELGAPDPTDPFSAMLAPLFSMMGPMLVSVSAGSMIGHLGQEALGQYDLPVPRSGQELLVVPAGIDERATEWGVTTTDLRLWVLVHEITTHRTLKVPHVGRRLESLLIDFAAAFRPNAEAIEQQLGDLPSLEDLTGPGGLGGLGGMGGMLEDPDALLSALRSPAQDLLVPQLDALLAAVLGYVDHMVDRICHGLVPSHRTIRARMRERTTTTAPADRFMERLLGLEVTATTLDRGRTFIDGIVERAGDEGLSRLWADELDLPTAAEIDAPGLWLARIGIETGPGDGLDFDIPDDLSGLDDL